MSWNNGYISDIAYQANFFSAQSPVHLNLACVLNGYEPVALDAPFTYCELGCGSGLTANALAASNPQGRFYACDFMPAHIAEARELASAAGLDNLTLLENSFADLAGGAIDLPMFDFVTMYGVYGWVNEENRAHIVDFLARYLKPGGIVLVNYNTMPGWAAVGPLQRLIRDVAKAAVGTRTQRCEHARRLIDQLTTLRAGYLVDNDSPEMQARLDSIKNAGDSYLAHEYMSDGPRQLYHVDVARQLARAELNFIGSTNMSSSFPALYLTPQQGELLERTPPAMRETVADYLANTEFRNDLFMRGTSRLSPQGQAESMQRMGLALIVPPAATSHKIQLVTGQMVDRDDLYQPVLEALKEAPRTLAELMALPAFKDESPSGVYQVAALLINCGQATCYHVRDDADYAAAHRLNRAMVSTPHYANANRVLVSPVLRSAIATSTTAQFVYRVLCDMGGAASADAVANRVLHLMGAEGHLHGKDAHGADADGMRTATDTIQRILQLLPPFWRRMQML